MITETLELLPLTQYGIPSGNYDGSSDTTFAGDQQKASNYYQRRIGVQSVRFVLDDFVGAITIQGTLDADPQDDSQWFDVYTFPDDSSATSANISHSITGNFTWVRARVTGFLGGTINSVTLTY